MKCLVEVKGLEKVEFRIKVAWRILEPLSKIWA